MFAAAAFDGEGAGWRVSFPATHGFAAMNSQRSGSRPRRAALLPVLGMGVLAFLGACSSGGGGGGESNGNPGEERVKPGTEDETFFVDFNQGGRATRLHLVEMFWARLVDIHEIDAQGSVVPEPVFRDFAINENIQSDGTNYRLETNPISQKTRLIIQRSRDAADTVQGTFDSLLRTAGDGLPPIFPRHDDGSTGDQYSFLVRNGALVLRFDDVLDDDIQAQQDLIETVRVQVGYPPETPFPARRFFDPNHGAVVGGQFHSTRVLIDLSVSETESSSMVPVNAVGLPPSLTSTTSPNVSVRVPTRTDFGSGQFELLRGFSGVPLARLENGPTDVTGATQDIVRAMRSGNSTDSNNGFLLDLSPPEILGAWPLRIDEALDAPDGQPGFDYLLDVTFTTVCRGAPQQTDVVSIGEAFFEVIQESATPDVDGLVQGLRVRNLSDQPIPAGTGLLGNAQFLSTFQETDPVPPGCWITFAPLPTAAPVFGVSTSARVKVRFSEPMDPSSISPFDNFYVVRGDTNTQVIPTTLIVGEITPLPDLKEFTFNPTQLLPHDTNTQETYHVRIDGPTDLAGNALGGTLPGINFEMAPAQPAVRTGNTVLRFSGTDELQPTGLPDLRGQFFLDFERQLIRPRPATFASYPVDRINPVPSIMIPFASGVQTPLSPLGSKLQTVWRYCDLGWQVLDETKYNLDVFGLAWAPRRGTVINDFFENFEILLAHSRRLPDESIDVNLLPKYQNSGLVRTFSGNILADPLSPQKVVHPRSLGYQINSVDLFLASSGTVMLPFPLNRVIDAPVTYTWRDTTVLELGGPNGAGIPLDIEAGGPLFLEGNEGYVAGPEEVPSFGLPLLLEYRCFPSNRGLGLNPLDISLAINSSAIPSFRAYSSGGINQSGIAEPRNPDQQLVAQGGFNPMGNPPGSPTGRADDNSFYIGQLDVVTRLSRVHTVWINTGIDDPDFLDPVVLPGEADQPAETQIVIEYRGADSFLLGDLDAQAMEPLDEASFPFDAQRLNAYGDIFAILPVSQGMRTINTHKILGSDLFPGSIQYVNGAETWAGDIDSIDNARYLQLRITFVSNLDTGLSPELSAIGISYSDQ